jgi:hypothetical protein
MILNRMKIINNVLSKDVCFWIINESDKQIHIDSIHSNYSDCVYIEKIPGVLNFVLFSCHYWLAEVKHLYNINLDLNIKEIFIAKNNFSQKCKKTTDKSFITLNIQLNQTTEALNYNDSTILLNQGDMIVYNKNVNRDCGNNYVLVLMIELA